MPVISEVLSSLALLHSQLSANGPENIFVTFEQRSASKTEFRNYRLPYLKQSSGIRLQIHHTLTVSNRKLHIIL